MKNIMILQPTSPLRSSLDIEDSYKLFLKKNADTLISVYKVDDNHPSRMYRIKNNFLHPLDKKNYYKRRQILEKVFHRNGAIYLFNKKNLIKKTIYGKKIIPYIMRLENSLNVDNLIDFKLAELLIK